MWVPLVCSGVVGDLQKPETAANSAFQDGQLSEDFEKFDDGFDLAAESGARMPEREGEE